MNCNTTRDSVNINKQIKTVTPARPADLGCCPEQPRSEVAEFSGAAVPFRFEIHTLYFSEDASAVENELHKRFTPRATNRSNPRKEFFFASPSEVQKVLLEKVGNLLESREQAEATESYQSLSMWPARPATGTREAEED